MLVLDFYLFCSFMRPKIVFGLLLFLLVVGVVAILFKQKPAVPVVTAMPVATNIALVPATVGAPIIPKKTMTTEERQAAIDAEKNRLFDWEAKDDDQSLSNILGDLTSPEKEVRLAAIEATKQFGSSNAIPVLKGIAANTDDTDEQKALLDAAEFLSLTPLSSYSGPKPALTPEQIQHKAQIDAQHQAHLQQSHHGQNQNAGQDQNGAGANSAQQNTQPAGQ